MRNLKKILALALALVMSLSLMATANAFTDDDSITDTYETAVTVLSGLKVFQGYDDGSFLPQGAITRAEVAAIIYRIVTGDVADTQVGIYADYNKFDDVASTSWYAGYVNFCANAEYIKGYDARTFGPNDPVTGYQALAMILRALGYDKNGEFTGTNWQVQTAAVGESRGITKNITAGTLGVAATREVVAEILFRAILVNKVNYTPAFGYTEDDTSLGWDTFELEDITGVVVANEYADLYDTEALDEGETRLNVDGEDYTIAYATTVEDLGEARHAYVTGETVLAISDAGNTVWENAGAETDIAKDSDFEDVTSLERGDAEDFINFADVSADTYEADIRIVYSLTGDADDAVSIKAGAKLTGKQYSDIKDIFTDDDLADGWVVVGTKYDPDTAAGDDISNDITFRNFVKEYLVSGSKDVIEVDGADNGEWLKVVDNDGDGEADYVFRVDFAMSVIERISKDEEYTLADLDSDDAVLFGNMVKVAASDIVTEDELAEGDVVIYTMIDGVYYVDLAEMVTETIDRKGINSKTETITCDGTDYVQSHIGYTSETAYMYDVTDAHTEETYDLYLDHFGYVRLFIESEYNVFMLLTDGWYEDDNRTETFQAYYWDVEAGEETLIDVVDDDDNFISNDQRGDEETWGNLWGADVTYSLNNYIRPNTFASNIAGYSETDDGYDLKSVEDSAERMNYTVQAFEVDGLKDKSLNAYDSGYDIQTTSDTQYYLVIRSADNRTASGWNVDDVITWTGYANAPDEAKLVDGAVGYAVTHASKASSTYTVADVVVFETTAYADRNTYFVYNPNNYLDFINRDRVEFVWGVGYDEEGAISNENQLLVEDDDDVVVNNGLIEFYEIFDNETVNYIGDTTGEYAEYNIYAGWARTSWDVEGRNYVRVSVAGVADDMYVYDDAPVYRVTFDVDDGYDVAELNRDKVSVGNLMILFTDSDKNVEYAINVSASLYEKLVITPVLDLWTAIRDDAFTVDELTFYGAVDADGDHSITLTYAEAAANPTGLYAGGRDILSITSGGSSVTIPTTPVKSTSDVVYTVVTEDKTGREEVWTLTVEAARSNNKLYKTVNGVKSEVTDPSDLNMPAEKWTIKEYVDQFTADDGAIVEWSFTTFGGTNFGVNDVPAGVTTDEVEMVVATVTAEDGTTAIYKNENAADVDTAAELKKAIDAAKEEITAGMKQALETADTNKLISDLDAALADTETSFSYAGSSRTMKGLLDGWFAAMDDVADEAALESFMSAAEPQLDDIAAAYVGQLKTDGETAADAALTSIKDSLYDVDVTTETVTDPADFEDAVDAAVAQLVTDEKATVSVLSYGDLSTKVASLSNGGRVTVTGVTVSLTYEGATKTEYQSLGDVVIPYAL